MISFDPTLVVPDELGSLHFVGVGGAGMSGIARLFLQAGHRVTGSDVQENANTRELVRLGATIHLGHDAAHIGDADALVVTSALWEDNPEYVWANEHGIPVLHRSQALVWLTRNARVVAVAGAHGKTTSTGMIVSALVALGENPSFVNGGVIEPMGVSAAAGSGELYVVEADESDGSFLLYDTAVALITNVDPDHLDHYGSRESFEQAFVDFAAGASEFVVASSDDHGARQAVQGLGQKRVISFGESPDATVRMHSVQTKGPVAFRLDYEGQTLDVAMRVPGHHNALNAAGAFAVLVGLGFDPVKSVAAIESFGGTQRRFELHGTVGGVSVFDDYAHHPTEVRAALTAARTVVGDGRIIAVHQPHLYSRTRLFCGEFAEVLEECADHTIVLDICGAREDPEPGVTGELVSAKFRDASKVAFIRDWHQAAEYTAQVARPGDYVITLGCGDVYRIVPQLLESLADAAKTTGG
ncbi:UDP-N-acetylmuramate--L-alanine ligase [Homoserinimonas sp. OAct 916]|uniref:UDP-N-acetylmuramate--L-alanine ligase n=1 Tax=Homoserinimonas sp. OAct 916 TaxID=2211450 RepID=UPI000DBE90EB|nr:UDP-N-acetylmuramate--L-alanine ligase [Homoserinimonas sp. OAct 916]